MKGKISISRPSYGDGKEKININIRDDESGIRFLEIEIGYPEFTQAITGLSSIECDFEVRGLDRIGKKLEIADIEFFVSSKGLYGSDRKDIARDAAKANTPDGWVADTYFGSQNSFFSKDDEEWARTTIRRWV